MRAAILWGIRWLAVTALVVTGAAAAAGEKQRLPNIVLIVADDLGYGDLSCYGSKTIRTPNLDRLARQGRRFTRFYVSQPVCTASRASLLTGCYANRVGLSGALNPTSTTGIHPQELLLSEILKQLGYATAIFGKWHLGNQAEFNPVNRGFDEFFGLLYSNDNHNKYHPVVRTFPPLYLMEGTKIVGNDPDQSQFTRQFTERSVRFIEKNKDRPFFLYVPHVMPHVPIFASEQFKGKSSHGLYADCVEELDWGVGQIMAALQQHGLEENTIVIFTSDNGPFLSYGDHAGSAGPLRGGKLNVFEGGVRMPCIMRWPGRMPAGQECAEVVATIDLLPTFAKLVGGKQPERKIDGKDVLPVLLGKPGARSPHEALYFYAGTELHAVLSGKWKLHVPHPYLEVDGLPGRNGKPANFENMKPADIKKSGLDGIASRHGYRIAHTKLELYDLDQDIGETTNVADQHPQVVERLLSYAEAARQDLGDSLTKRQGQNVRPAGQAKSPSP